MFRKQQTK